ncbi:phosphoadenosine phosphosulfate reductase family protein [Arcobacter cryaerophilus gv. pseudocryaerophilus]|uniref:Phosphoadenosine phosphosulfate reductase family protein n=3 Tax=unclassified Arcobacter TaxID=2593671 RepID=A0AA96DEF0_9BACT|nr:phosphoadenosine phosphosulfate reductase family protein [Arcobacter sp. AZ-2023]WPD06082.1 phosphoadenosine phosphosulfate reductase family protein [Arcobacter sp. DSM 115956]WPD08174.1 phosphoadenosine phosphosulfate reductase family protein [Arcobacter sp. DSM 115955]WNL32439.1 phosphoadenosine phosphosulfate reductase family protein [Arcobacter sp. AZ-2023]WNP38589.1 phosphoadenosine phosphosulfate reductase family protein [Arcobacter sp. AZ-2023]
MKNIYMNNRLDELNDNKTLKEKISNTKEVIEKYYLEDERPLCVAYSGGKDSTALVFLVLEILIKLRKMDLINKKTYIINSNTLAELPPLLEHLETSLKCIKEFSNINNLNVEVYEVVPLDKHTLNVQLLGVGMPPPSLKFRWCTTKLKVSPIENKLKELFPNGKFISVVGSRRDESTDRKKRIIKQSKVNSHLKINDRFPEADNLYPLEYWDTKNIWEYIFTQNKNVINIDFLWELYSDASNKSASECSFVGAGGKHIDEGKIGCGQSRFGCWQCYVVRDNDKSLDGLLKSGYKDISLYKDYRELYWNKTQEGWQNTRDVYSHRTQYQEFFDEKYLDRIGMTKAKGIKLSIRKSFFKELLNLNSKLSYSIISENEIDLIQIRWLYEGDLELTAYKMARRMNLISLEQKKKDIYLERKQALRLYKIYFSKNKEIKQYFSILTIKRYCIQYIKNPNKIEKMFFPSKKYEKLIRNEWKSMKIKKKDKSNRVTLTLNDYLRINNIIINI